MKRFPTTAMAAILLVMLATWPAQAQYGGGGGTTVDRPPVQDGEVEVTTPCSTIVVQGTDWGANTVVYIDREFEDDCPGTGNPDDVLSGTSEDQPRSASTSARTEVPVSADGSFAAELRVPSGAVGDYVVQVSGEDADGITKRQTFTFDVDPTANFVSGTPSNPAESGNAATMALAIGMATLLLAVGTNWPSLVAKIRRH